MTARHHVTARFGTALFLICLMLAQAAWAVVDVQLTQLGSRSHATTGELRESTPELVAEIESTSGLNFVGPLSLVVCSDRESFTSYSASVGSDFIGEALGFFAPPPASGGTPTIALNLQLIDELSTRARGVYKHELLHAALWQNLPHWLRPLWFEEGLAQYVSETPVEAALRASGWVGGGRDPTSLEDVSTMLHNPEETAIGYPHAAAAVHLLAEKYGAHGLRTLIAELKYTGSLGNRDRFEEVFQRALNGASYSEFQTWYVGKRERATFLGALLWLGANYWPLAMGFAAVLLVLAIWRRRRKHRAMMDNWRDVDAAYPADPAWAAASRPEARSDTLADAMEAHSELHEDPVEEAMREHREVHGYSDDDDAEPPPARRLR